MASGYAADISIRDLFGAVWRQRLIVLASIVIFTLLGIFMPRDETVTYRSVARVLIEGAGGGRVADPTGVLLTTVGLYDMSTQLQILQSQEVLQESLVRAGITAPGNPSQPDWAQAPRLTVHPVQDSSVIEITVESRNPEHSRRMASAVPGVYAEWVMRTQREETGRSVSFVESRIVEEVEKLRSAEDRLADFKLTRDVVDRSAEEGIRVSQRTGAESAVIQGEAEVRAARAVISALESARDELPTTLDQAVTQDNRPQLEGVRTQLQELQIQREQALVTYLPESLTIRQIDAQIAAQERFLESLDDRFTTATTTHNPHRDSYDQQIIQARVELQGALARLDAARAIAELRKAEWREYTPVSQLQAVIERDIMESQRRLEVLRGTLDDLRLRDNSLRTPVADITPASPPFAITGRSPVLYIAISAILGLVFGLFGALVRDTLLDKVNTLDDAGRVLGAPFLGRIPLRSKRRKPLIEDPQRALAFEGYRLVRSSLLYSAGAEPVNRFMICSAKPGEGKSVVAANLAVAMALDSKKVILVDANFRKPAQHSLFGAEPKPGLSELLHGQVELDEVLKPGSVEGLFLLPAGTVPANPSELLASPSMRMLHQELGQRCDVLIYDSAAFLPLADAQALASVVKDVVMVIELGQPTKTEMKETNSLISLAGARIAGLVTNKVKVKAEELSLG